MDQLALRTIHLFREKQMFSASITSRNGLEAEEAHRTAHRLVRSARTGLWYTMANEGGAQSHLKATYPDSELGVDSDCRIRGRRVCECLNKKYGKGLTLPMSWEWCVSVAKNLFSSALSWVMIISMPDVSLCSRARSSQERKQTTFCCNNFLLNSNSNPPLLVPCIYIV